MKDIKIFTTIKENEIVAKASNYLLKNKKSIKAIMSIAGGLLSLYLLTITLPTVIQDLSSINGDGKELINLKSKKIPVFSKFFQ